MKRYGYVLSDNNTPKISKQTNKNYSQGGDCSDPLPSWPCSYYLPIVFKENKLSNVITSLSHKLDSEAYRFRLIKLRLHAHVLLKCSFNGSPFYLPTCGQVDLPTDRPKYASSYLHIRILKTHHQSSTVSNSFALLNFVSSTLYELYCVDVPCNQPN